MTDETKKPEDEQELVPVVDDDDTDGGDDAPAAADPPAGEEPPAQDARVDNSDGDDDDDDAPTGDKATDETNRRRRQQRRQAQKRARERQEQLLAQLTQQNEVMARRLAQLEQHTVSSVVSSVDARIAQAEADAEQALNIFAAATDAGNGKDAAAAQRIREAALEEARQLKARRAQLAEQAPAQPETPAQPQVNPAVVSYAKSWVENNPWYDPNLGNDESKIARQIDLQLVKEGYDPSTREHWAELTHRLNEVFSAAGGGDDGAGDPTPAVQKNGRKGPPTSSTREGGGRQLKPNEIYVAPERKQAMMEAGIWDDPVRRQRALKEYARFDAENTAR